ncbi:alpha/beta fold hydrolase [Marinobacter sp. 71-i]|uniref:Alpha/beta fold hydrolase n=1 Tax=Marinobacter iranensis TaxID=2962607 RepID=A0ABT5YHW4_9GAMM|nr:alpha/beta hydrolase [Marinobacter iranensis]MDF0752635.1 alpha/beta fold hydrolase [Marinobacter iranensis]
MQTDTSPVWQRHASAILSGFLGDWLEARNNPLTMPMAFFHGRNPVEPDSPDVVEEPGSTLCLCIHGLMELESIWTIPHGDGAHYGSLLAAGNSDITPLTLRYNTGRPIYRNGEDLADLLETLVSHWPLPVERIILIGHSMGGLLIRSACHHGQLRGNRWVEQLSDCVYIGSPHDGSWLAKGAKATAELMNGAPRDYFRVLGEVIDLRSEGIRNLSRGDVVNPEDGEPPLLPGARHYVVCGLLARSRQHPVNALFGDALVHESSACGSERKGWTLSDVASFPGIDHIRLAHHPDVAAQLKEWLL